MENSVEHGSFLDTGYYAQVPKHCIYHVGIIKSTVTDTSHKTQSTGMISRLSELHATGNTVDEDRRR